VEIAAGMKGTVRFRSYLARERYICVATRVTALAEMSMHTGRISPRAISTTLLIIYAV
jgi:hypothetical protein